MMTSGMPVVCCTQHTRPGWFMTSDHWHRAGDILLLPPLELKREGKATERRGQSEHLRFPITSARPSEGKVKGPLKVCGGSVTP